MLLIFCGQMEDFKSYLLSKRIVSKKKVIYYLVWVSQFYAFCDKIPGADVSAEEIDGFAKHLMKVFRTGRSSRQKRRFSFSLSQDLSVEFFGKNFQLAHIGGFFSEHEINVQGCIRRAV